VLYLSETAFDEACEYDETHQTEDCLLSWSEEKIISVNTQRIFAWLISPCIWFSDSCWQRKWKGNLCYRQPWEYEKKRKKEVL